MKKKVCMIVASEMTVKAFLVDHLRALCDIYQVSLVVNTNNSNFLMPYGLKVEVLPLAIFRKIQPLQDLRVFIHLYRLLRKARFDLIHSITPKAGLLAMTAGFLAGISCRVHTFTGQVWVTRRGGKRLLLKSVDRLLASFATNVLVDSFSQRDFLIENRVVSAEQSSVLANGSISGVDVVRFQPDNGHRRRIRQRLGIADGDFVFLYLGRLTRDKGILDLAAAFALLCPDYEHIHLLLVGPDEEGMRPEMAARGGPYRDRLHFVDYTDSPEQYMAAADTFVLPSYREGFGTAILEAAACSIPSIASRIYGITDAVAEDVTGLLHEPGNIVELAGKMRVVVNDVGLAQRMGVQARQRARQDYDKERVTAALLDYYAAITE